MTKINVRVACALSLLLLARAAQAHTGVHPAGLEGGLLHPLLGPDHLLAMVCVGVVSMQLGGSSVWRVPAAFVLAMIVGGATGMARPGAGFAEAGIAISLVALGSAIVFRQRMPHALVMACVGVFGFCHGYAHGVEIPQAASPWLYTVGFVTSTTLLHVCGVGLGWLGARGRTQAMALRAGGLAVGVMGLAYLGGFAGLAA
ncbi:HupE/UreJ family protein [Variovorax dokdonensis]|uniref:HupE/UreJ family protein n=1 Tax=Variovorax dokdonensis TaxID=344883 RepID=A0ABT7NDT8_9BURK|nr:HupE/UreJ family protein [Variovorax dokdonensis]MDM0046112.1 HupE/UreJ family protein [Variovorax dokdonensis]